MMKVELIAVGNLKEKFYTDACREYGKRLGAFCHIHVTEIAEYKCPDSPGEADIARTLKQEGQRILDALPDNATVVALCIEGKELSSEQLARYLDGAAVDGRSHLCFVIGGSWGLDDAVKRRADLRLSMSPMTFPHRLARVMLLEQLYRAFSINAGHKYHK